VDFPRTITLALVQGLTEFLPVSSSAHLALLAGWGGQGLAFDVALHFGTLFAVCAYFRRDFYRLLHDAAHGELKMLRALTLATVPIVLAALVLRIAAGGGFVEALLRKPLVIAAATVMFALALWAAELHVRRRPAVRGLGELRMRDALVMGCAQAFAIIPGASRSGVTMTAGLLLGLSRTDTVRFSFLLAAPVIFLAAVWQLWELTAAPAAHNVPPVDWPFLTLGVFLAAAAAWLCIHTLLRWIERIGFLPFVLYRLLLGALLLYLHL